MFRIWHFVQYCTYDKDIYLTYISFIWNVLFVNFVHMVQFIAEICYLSVALTSWNSTVDLSDKEFWTSSSSLWLDSSEPTMICSSSLLLSLLSLDAFLTLGRQQHIPPLEGFDGIEVMELVDPFWRRSLFLKSSVDRSPLVLNWTSFFIFSSLSSIWPGIAVSSNPEMSL